MGNILQLEDASSSDEDESGVDCDEEDVVIVEDAGLPPDKDDMEVARKKAEKRQARQQAKRELLRQQSEATLPSLPPPPAATEAAHGIATSAPSSSRKKGAARRKKKRTKATKNPTRDDHDDHDDGDGDGDHNDDRGRTARKDSDGDDADSGDSDSDSDKNTKADASFSATDAGGQLPTLTDSGYACSSSPRLRREINLGQFSLIRTIGKGGFGKVQVVRRKASRRYYALKYVSKAECIKQDVEGNVLFERELLEEMRHPFIVNLHFSFQDEYYLYFGLDLMLGGDLQFLIDSKEFIFTQSAARFYMAELCCAVSYLHSIHIVHRDIKPGNILLDAAGHIHLTDFNLATRLRDGRVSYTICGTLRYMAPEVLQAHKRGYSFAVDWWSAGIVLYEMIMGDTPFKANDYLALERQQAHFTPAVLEEHVSHALLDFACGLLSKNPQQRTDASSAFRSHPFFVGSRAHSKSHGDTPQGAPRTSSAADASLATSTLSLPPESAELQYKSTLSLLGVKSLPLASFSDKSSKPSTAASSFTSLPHSENGDAGSQGDGDQHKNTKDYIDWDALLRKQVKAPFVPDENTCRFDPSLELEEQLLDDSPLAIVKNKRKRDRKLQKQGSSAGAQKGFWARLFSSGLDADAYDDSYDQALARTLPQRVTDDEQEFFRSFATFDLEDFHDLQVETVASSMSHEEAVVFRKKMREMRAKDIANRKESVRIRKSKAGSTLNESGSGAPQAAGEASSAEPQRSSSSSGGGGGIVKSRSGGNSSYKQATAAGEEARDRERKSKKRSPSWLQLDQGAWASKGISEIMAADPAAAAAAAATTAAQEGQEEV